MNYEGPFFLVLQRCVRYPPALAVSRPQDEDVRALTSEKSL